MEKKTKEVPLFIPRNWTYLGQWHQPTICNGFWCYWHTTSVVHRLLPHAEFHTLLNPDGQFWIAKEDIVSFHNFFDSLDEDKTITWIKQLHAIGEETEKKHLDVLKIQGMHYSEYIPDLFSTYKELTGLWSLAWLGDELGAYMVKKNIYTEEELLSIISRNVRSTWLTEEYQSIRRIAQEVFRSYPDVKPDEVTEQFIKRDPAIAELVEGHVEKYIWFGTHHFMGEAYTIEKCLTEVKDCLGKESERKEETNGSSFAQWHFLVPLLLEFAYWRTHAAEVAVKVVFLSREKLEACAKDFSLSYDDFIFFSDEEILDSIREKKAVVNAEKIKERKAGQGCYLEGKHLKVLSGDDLRRFLEVLKGDTIETGSDLQEFSGTVACKGGVVTGRVSILITPSDFKDFQPGNILVVPETTPDFVPFMQSAKAIITERGGVTSHAAIISREMRIPCIIGTKIATQVLKNGDMVEVNTDTGIVRIIK